MKRRFITFIIAAGVLLVGAAGASGNNQSGTQVNDAVPAIENISNKPTPICDGTAVTTACSVDGVKYKAYIYHPAIAEKSHTETVTTYHEETSGYCTLCNDGTYSPSCATGRGACSHHGGVAQWGAPVVRTVPVNTTKTVIDAPAVEEYYEKILE